MSVQSDLAVSAKAFAFNDQTEISAVIYELASQAGILSMTPSELAAASKCYCFDEGTARGVIAYLLAVKAGLQTTKPADLAKLAKCFCFDRDTWKKVVVYLLESGGGGTTVQDMQVAWTPTNLKFGQALFWSPRSVDPNWQNLTTLSFSLTTGDGFDFNGGGTALCTSVSFPNLTNLTVGGDALISFRFCPSLTTFSAPLWTPNNGDSVDFRSNALNAASVNAILAACVSNPTYGVANEAVSLQGGTNAAPSGQGVADKATLIGRGAVVTTN